MLKIGDRVHLETVDGEGWYFQDHLDPVLAEPTALGLSKDESEWVDVVATVMEVRADRYVMFSTESPNIFHMSIHDADFATHL